jgi:PKD repeat protein
MFFLGALSAAAQQCQIALTPSKGASPAAAVFAGTTVTLLAKPGCDLDQITLVLKDAAGVTISTESRVKSVPGSGAGETFSFPAGYTVTAQTYSASVSGNPAGCQACVPVTGAASISFFAATGVAPASGSVVGGNSVSVTGKNFPTSGCTVGFGDNNVPAAAPSSATQITVTAPASTGFAAGAVPVSVTCNGTPDTKGAGSYTYLAAAPTVTLVTPSSGPIVGGTDVVITGLEFTTLCTTVTFDGIPSPKVVRNSTTSITATVPKGARVGQVDVVVGCGGVSPKGTYTYVASTPSISSITPGGASASAISTKGETVTIKGSGLSATCTVWFGSQKASDVKLSSATANDSITVTAPPYPNSSNPVGDPIVPVVISCGDKSSERTQGAPATVTYAAAAFTFSPGSPVAASDVTFTDKSKGTATLKWEFSDGFTSTSPTFAHQFVAPGVYSVKLTATYADNSASSSTRSVTVVDQATTFASKLIVPGQGRLQSSQGFFKSQMWITNPFTDKSLILQLLYVPAGGTADPANTVSITVPARASRAYSDVLWQAFGKDNANGNIVVNTTGSDLPLVSARTYADASFASSTGSGSSGQFIPAFRLDGEYSARAMLSGLAPNDQSRSNLGIVNLANRDQSFRIEAFNETGTLIATSGVKVVRPLSLFQQGAQDALGLTAQSPQFSVVVSPVDSPDAALPFFAYASKLDNTTQDPIFIPSTLPARNEQWLSPVAALQGGGAKYDTSLLFAQPDASSAVRPMTLDVSADEIDLIRDTAGAPQAEATLGLTSFPTLQQVFNVPVASKFYERSFVELLTTLGNLVPDAQYTMHILSKAPLVAWARLFSSPDSDPLQHFGQFAPAFGSEDLIGADGSILQGVSQDAATKTNFGLINVTDKDVSMDVLLFNSSGVQLGSTYTVIVKANRASGIIGVAGAFAGIAVTDGYLLVTPSDESSVSTVYAWASVNDRSSTDSIYVRPQSVPSTQVIVD